jgi:hypothetical protein
VWRQSRDNHRQFLGTLRGFRPLTSVKFNSQLLAQAFFCVSKIREAFSFLVTDPSSYSLNIEWYNRRARQQGLQPT